MLWVSGRASSQMCTRPSSPLAKDVNYCVCSRCGTSPPVVEKKHYLYIQASIHDIVNGFGTFPALVLAAGSHLSRGRHFTGQAVRSNFKYLTWVFSVWERKRDRERLVFLLNDFKRQTQHLVWCLTLWRRGINKSVSHCFLFYMRYLFF